MALEISSEQLGGIERHGESAYPRECCGALLGREEESGARVVETLLPLDNRRDEDASRGRFLLTAEDYRLAEKTAERKGMEILGFYHSHPDHPARPSEYDREHAWPWYSYIIVAVERGRAEAVTSWVLAEDRSQFLAEPMLEPRVSGAGIVES